MSETTTEAGTSATDGTAKEQTTTTEAPAEKDWQAEADKWKRLSRENETKAKANADAARRLAEIEESAKTEQQKIAERAEAAERRAAESEARLLRLEVAAEKGLTPSQGKRLVGSTREELAADADELLKTFQPAAPSFDGGARTSAPAPADMNRVLRQALGRDQ